MNKYIKTYKKIGDWLSVISIIAVFVFLLDYFGLFGNYEILKNRQSYLLIISGISFFISNLIDLSTSLKSTTKVNLVLLIISILMSLFLIYMGYKIYNKAFGTCPFNAIYNDTFKRIDFK